VNPSGWIETTFDALSRKTQVKTTADGAYATTSYIGNATTVTDQHDASSPGHSRKIITDALGRLTEVYEDPLGLNYLSSYQYDVLDKLRTVTQGTQTRTFVYDSLGRLTSATNPESGTVSYTYDNNGNVLTKTDARNVIVTYAYDALNRNATTDYSDTASINPDIKRYYDTSTNGKGRYNGFYKGGDYIMGANVEHTSIDSFDSMGRPLVKRQLFKTGGVWSQTYQMQLTYEKAGNILTEIYPSGHTVTYNYDAAGRPGDNGAEKAFSGNLSDDVTRTYDSEIRYHEMGGMEQERFGTDTPVYDKSLYNSRGQLAEIRVSTYSILSPGQETNWNRGAIINHYSHAAGAWGATGGGPDNNSNLQKQEIYIPDNDQITGYTNVVQQYSYDSLNRLTSVYDKPFNGTPDFIQGYVYDRWGNRTIDQALTTSNAPRPQFTANSSTNQLAPPSSYTMTYDAVGNLTYDNYQGGTGGGGTRTYDAENRMTSAQFVSGQLQTATYTYDGDGRRTKRNVGAGGEVWQVYGMGGELLAEYAANAAPSSPQKEYGYCSGELLVTAEPQQGSAGTYRASANFSSVQGQGGWYYLDSTGAQMTYDSANSWWRGAETYNLIWAAGGHPGAAADSVRRWVAPAAGAVRITGSVSDANTACGDGVVVTISKGAQVLWQQTINNGNATGSSYDLTVNVVTGDQINFTINRRGDNGCDSTNFDPTITYVGQVKWLVADQLGTPRMVVDQTGSLAGMTRHDYFSFGEEIASDSTWRTAARGYVGDTVRQKFTGKECDEETELDYSNARFYAGRQGRFTSADPLGPWAMAENEKLRFMSEPQQWNRYSYVTNNPLKYTDPTGLERYAEGTSDEDQRIIHEALVNLSQTGTDKQKKIANFLLNNDVTIRVESNPGRGYNGQTDYSDSQEGYANTQTAIDSGPLTMGQAAGLITIDIMKDQINKGAVGSMRLEGLLAHEGQHAHDLARVAQGLSDPTGPNAGFDPTQFRLERDGFIAQAEYLRDSPNHIGWGDGLSQKLLEAVS
jgi:RHS repeat-associated protein